MRKGLVYRDFFEPACRPVGRTTQSTASFIAALCFLSGFAFAAFGPASPEERFVGFCFAFALAIGFYMSGYILRQMFWLSDKLSEKLSEIIKARCVRLLAPFANEVLGCQVQLLQSRLNESKSELKHLRGEIDNARKAEADLHKVVVEIHDRAQVATQHLEAEKAKLQAALDRVNGERVRLAYDLANMKRQADYSMQLPVVHTLAKSDCISFQRMTRTAPPA
jgi:predicted component of type VI protein secretion system